MYMYRYIVKFQYMLVDPHILGSFYSEYIICSYLQPCKQTIGWYIGIILSVHIYTPANKLLAGIQESFCLFIFIPLQTNYWLVYRNHSVGSYLYPCKQTIGWYIGIILSVHIYTPANKLLAGIQESFCLFIFIPLQTNYWLVYRNHSVCSSISLSVQFSRKDNQYLMDERRVMKLYTVALYKLRMYMKEDNPNLNY